MNIATAFFSCPQSCRRLPFRLAGRPIVLLLALVACLSAPRAARGDPAPVLTLNVFVQDLAGVSSEELDAATEIASAVYRRVGVDIRWFLGEAAVRTLPAERNAAFCRSVISVSLLPDAAAETITPRPDRATVGLAAPGTRFARIFADRVRNAATIAGLAEGRLLGYVIAHEIGHLLLPPGSHTPGGLMSADLDLRYVRQRALWFDEGQAAWIRQALARRPAWPA